jgi:hypothetical protein
MRINQDPNRFAHPSAVSSLFCVVALLMLSVPQMKAAFSPPIPLTNTATDTSDQQVATSGSNVYIVWRDNELGATVSNPEIYFTRSTNGGVSFEAPQNISQSVGFSGTGNPRIAASGQHVYIAFSDTGGTFLAHSENGGESFLPKTNLTTTFGLQLGSSGWVAAAGENLYMVCRQSTTTSTGTADDIFMARFGGYGTSFLGSQNVSESPAPAHSIDPVVVASGNSVYVAWSDPVPGSSNDIYFRRSIDGGVGFGPVKNISSNSGLSRFPSIAADGMKVWLAWTDKTLGNDDILFARSADAGDSFEPTLNLSNNATGSVDPVVTGRGNNVYVAWADVPPGAESNKLDIYLKSSSDAGFSFDPSLVKNVSETIAVLSRAPRVAATNAMLSVYWGESLPTGIGTGTQRDIFYASMELSIPVPPPSMLSLSPGAGMQTQSVDVDLTGSGFQSGATLALSGTGVTVTDVAFVSPTAMKAKMNVSLTATPGGRDLTVTNPDGQSATLSGAFTVMSASALMLIEITRTDVNMGAANGGLLASSSDSSNSNFKSLLSHLENAERALLSQPADLATAINQMDAFYIKIGNMAKGKKPEITPALYTTLYNDYALVMGSLGGTVKPAQ